MGKSVMSLRNKQQGVVLIVALIALVAISMAGIALMRTVDTSNVVAGNLAFNEAAIQAADIGAELAYLVVEDNKASDPAQSGCLYSAANCPSYYYPNFSAVDPISKLPMMNPLNWSASQEVLLPGETTGNGSYHVQYVIERMCTGTGTGNPKSFSQTVADNATFADCKAAPIYTSTGALVAGSGKLYFRVTVQANGPRNTRALAQYFYGVQDAVY